jgi:hypothetical protein
MLYFPSGAGPPAVGFWSYDRKRVVVQSGFMHWYVLILQYNIWLCLFYVVAVAVLQRVSFGPRIGF